MAEVKDLVLGQRVFWVSPDTQEFGVDLVSTIKILEKEKETPHEPDAVYTAPSMYYVGLYGMDSRPLHVLSITRGETGRMQYFNTYEEMLEHFPRDQLEYWLSGGWARKYHRGHFTRLAEKSCFHGKVHKDGWEVKREICVQHDALALQYPLLGSEVFGLCMHSCGSANPNPEIVQTVVSSAFLAMDDDENLVAHWFGHSPINPVYFSSERKTVFTTREQAIAQMKSLGGSEDNVSFLHVSDQFKEQQKFIRYARAGKGFVRPINS